MTNTVVYYARNGKVFIRDNVWYYEVQAALMDLSREAYENGTSLDHIEIW